MEKNRPEQSNRHPKSMNPEEASESNRFHDFICTCGNEGKLAAQALRDEVEGRLRTGGEAMGPLADENGGIVSRVVMSLGFEHNASITGIAVDQWFGISAQSRDGTFATFIECDQLEDGFAATWKAFADRQPTA